MRGPRNGRGKKSPASGGPGAGQVACGFASAVKSRGSRLPLRCPASSLAPIDKNAELLRVPCGPRGYPPAGTINTPVQVEKLAGAIGPGFDLERSQAESRLATDDGTKEPPNNLSTAVFGRRKSTV